MKKIVMSVMYIVIVLACSIHVFAAESFDDSEYNNSVSITENIWTEFNFDSNLYLKVDVSEKDTTTVFEVSADNYSGTMQYYVFTKGNYVHLTQHNVSSIPGYISVPHIDNIDSSYIIYFSFFIK